ncbi:MAG: metallophosphoesterase [Syntrophorhabdales bacterium]
MRVPRWSRASWVLLLTVLIAASAWAEPWKFGVMGDTQWTVPDDGKSPNGVPVGIIAQINQQFIGAGVKFVVQVGDLVETYSDAALETRSRAAQDLCSAGIGFYPLRGNHEPAQAAAQSFQVVFPQTQGNGPCVHGARGFTSPSPNLKGLSYSFDYNDARFVLLDQFTRTDGSGSSSTDTNMLDQLTWIDSALAGKPAHGHAFVFGHKNLIGENHTDVLFGADPGQNLAAQDQFIRSLGANGVHYYVSGHDHIHQRSIVSSPNRGWKVQEIITASASSKFYIPLGNPELPGTTNNDVKYNNPPREASIAQERNTIGYYIYTIDGQRVTVDYYSAAANPTRVKNEYVITTTPTLTFTKRESFGYSLNGKEFLIAQGKPYTAVRDKSPFAGTDVKILAGYNQSAKDGSGRPLNKAVDTGWERGQGGTASDILSLWGMGRSLGSGETDIYALSMRCNHRRVSEKGLRRGLFGLVSMNQNGDRVNAVEKNFGSTKRFILGPWRPGYGLGTYGVDPHTHIAWAVLNYDGNFAVADFQVDRRE